MIKNCARCGGFYSTLNAEVIGGIPCRCTAPMQEPEQEPTAADVEPWIGMADSALRDAKKAVAVLFTMLTKIGQREGAMVADEIGANIGTALKEIAHVRSGAIAAPHPAQPQPVVPDDLAERFAAVHSLEPELNQLVYEALCKRPRTAGAATTIIAQYPAQPSSEHGICPNCVSPWKCNGPHIGERPPSGYEDAPIQAQEPTAADWRKAIAASLEHSGRNQLANGAIDWIENRAREISRERKA